MCDKPKQAERFSMRPVRGGFEVVRDGEHVILHTPIRWTAEKLVTILNKP